MPEVVITKDNWTNIIDIVRAINPKASAAQCLLDYYPVCINHIITPLSRELWNMYCHIGGLKNETFESYMELPQVVHEGFSIIQQEVDRIDKVRQSKQQSSTDHQQRTNSRRK